ncbi:cellulase [Panicum miliaceum]|uniref:Cellulase n=1 Tax=Panicum miliaceum TaxID=4540 RepID=A0A3L6Q531_PANMI|nr:cellulase [Panicum miliaceum]
MATCEEQNREREREPLCRQWLPGLQLYKAHSDSYICTLVLGTSSFQASQYTPGGLIWLRGPLACQRRQIQRPHGPPHSPGTSGAAPPSSVPSSMAAHGWEEQAGKFKVEETALVADSTGGLTRTEK